MWSIISRPGERTIDIAAAWAALLLKMFDVSTYLREKN
jgi:hypothetical protein